MPNWVLNELINAMRDASNPRWSSILDRILSRARTTNNSTAYAAFVLVFLGWTVHEVASELDLPRLDVLNHYQTGLELLRADLGHPAIEQP